MYDIFEIALDAKKKEGLYRERVAYRDDPRIQLNFASSDYLSLSNHPEVLQACKKALDKYGISTTSSQLVAGNTKEHQALEEALADFFGTERALVFNNGYVMNVGILKTLLSPRDTVVIDRLCHASLIDGLLASKADYFRYAHLDMLDLADKMQNPDPDCLLTDGVFSMEGDQAPLAEILKLTKLHKTFVMVDDAHGIGVLGKKGQGICEHQGIPPRAIDLLVGTFGKSFGCFGAFALGSDALIEYLMQYTRAYCYSTAIPPSMAAAARTALHFIEKDLWRREHLQRLILQFQKGARELGLKILPSETPIQPIIVGDEAQTMHIQKRLLERGILVSAIRPPTVPKGSSRLRISLNVCHQTHDIDRLLESLQEEIHVIYESL